MLSTDFFKLLSDQTRLRILNLLKETELSVNELMELLELPQPKISKHLKLLKDSGLLTERPDGTRHYYSLNLKNAGTDKAGLLDSIFGEEIFSSDRLKIKACLERRKLFAENFFRSDDQARKGLGTLYSAESLLIAMAGLLPANSRILDCGYGEGALLKLLSVNTGLELHGVDLFPHPEQAQHQLPAKLLQADLTALPYENDYFDLVFNNMTLHHIPEPKKAFREISRVLKTYGKLALIDFHKHTDERMRGKYKDFWLGFSLEDITGFCAGTALEVTMHAFSVKKQNMPENFTVILQKISKNI